MPKAIKGNTVRIHYKGTLTDGTEFDTSQGKDPLEFTLGSGQVISGFDNGVDGMELHEKKTIFIPANEAYGEWRDELVINVPRSDLPSDLNPEVGMHLQMTNQNNQVIHVLVSDLKDDSITLDANHPLAGQDLTFDIELVEIVN